jgi:hypothetical protein
MLCKILRRLAGFELSGTKFGSSLHLSVVPLPSSVFFEQHHPSFPFILLRINISVPDLPAIGFFSND